MIDNAQSDAARNTSQQRHLLLRFTKASKDLVPHPAPTPFPGCYRALQSELANKLLTIEGRAVEGVPVGLECGSPLFALIDAHDKFKSHRIGVDIHFFEGHALLLEKVPGCVRVFAAHPGVHSDMFRFQRSTSFRPGSKARIA